jgi:two-component system phosphate regulon sensor histidine kinase PhoR
MSARLSERMEAITRERSQLAAILSSMVEGLVAVDGDERIVHINAMAARLAGTPAEQCVGLRVWEAMRIPALTEVLREALARDEAVERDIVLVDTQHERALTVYAAPWRDGSGAAVGAVAVLHDRTRVRQLEKTRQDFVANASHEFKSPVTAIRGLAETIQDDPGMDAETRSTFVGRILDETNRLAGIVGDMLALARAEGQFEQEEHTLLDLRDVVARTMATFESAANANSITLQGQSSKKPVEVLGSSEALQGALGSLIENALNYTPAGGTVSVHVAEDGSTARIAVADTGIGIATEHHERIFERFYRIDEARSRQLGGTGLGLAIAKHVVQSHHGQITVDSRLGQGSTFTISLPLATEKA